MILSLLVLIMQTKEYHISDSDHHYLEKKNTLKTAVTHCWYAAGTTTLRRSSCFESQKYPHSGAELMFICAFFWCRLNINPCYFNGLGFCLVFGGHQIVSLCCFLTHWCAEPQTQTDYAMQLNDCWWIVGRYWSSLQVLHLTFPCLKMPWLKMLWLFFCLKIPWSTDGEWGCLWTSVWLNVLCGLQCELLKQTCFSRHALTKSSYLEEEGTSWYLRPQMLLTGASVVARFCPYFALLLDAASVRGTSANNV